MTELERIRIQSAVLSACTEWQNTTKEQWTLEALDKITKEAVTKIEEIMDNE